MPRECHVCGKRKKSGGSTVHRGLAKIKGGIGLQLVKNTKRTFKPNLQPARINENGTVRKVKVCTACLRSGKVVKAG